MSSFKGSGGSELPAALPLGQIQFRSRAYQLEMWEMSLQKNVIVAVEIFQKDVRSSFC